MSSAAAPFSRRASSDSSIVRSSGSPGCRRCGSLREPALQPEALGLERRARGRTRRSACARCRRRPARARRSARRCGRRDRPSSADSSRQAPRAARAARPIFGAARTQGNRRPAAQWAACGGVSSSIVSCSECSRRSRGPRCRCRLASRTRSPCRAAAPPTSAAIAVDLANGRPVFERNADSSLAPASNEKLLVTYAALVSLGVELPLPHRGGLPRLPGRGDRGTATST